ncbi:carboxypeptidase regulatory-like domain-containing protein [Halomicroarcula sp. GCM10025709]|uniref:carboxypeptidase regulatory-like domain-containing protein n=1 Tax=Halomicroarcula sp. GCM10025709 TaxID=3252669 RepID=UPI0036082490
MYPQSGAYLDEYGVGQDYSTLSGTVTDGSGNVVGAANVTVTNSTGATIATTTTDAGGDYSVTVSDGIDATVSVSKSGYKTASDTTAVSGATTLDITLPQSDQTKFVLDDQTQRGLFPATQTTLVVEKRSNLRPPFTYKTVSSKTFGSDEEVTTNLKLGAKYRVAVNAPGSSLSWRGWQYTTNTPDVIQITPTGPSKYITNQTQPTPTATGSTPTLSDPGTPTPADGGYITPDPTPTPAPITPAPTPTPSDPIIGPIVPDPQPTPTVEPTPTPGDGGFVTPEPITPRPTPTQAPIEAPPNATATPTPVTTRDYPYEEGYAWATRRCTMPDGSPGLYVEYYDSDKETTRITADPQLTGNDGVTREVTIDKTFVEPIGYWSSCIAAEEFPPIDDEPSQTRRRRWRRARRQRRRTTVGSSIRTRRRRRRATSSPRQRRSTAATSVTQRRSSSAPTTAPVGRSPTAPRTVGATCHRRIRAGTRLIRRHRPTARTRSAVVLVVALSSATTLVREPRHS